MLITNPGPVSATKVFNPKTGVTIWLFGDIHTVNPTCVDNTSSRMPFQEFLANNIRASKHTIDIFAETPILENPEIQLPVYDNDEIEGQLLEQLWKRFRRCLVSTNRTCEFPNLRYHNVEVRKSKDTVIRRYMNAREISYNRLYSFNAPDLWYDWINEVCDGFLTWSFPLTEWTTLDRRTKAYKQLDKLPRHEDRFIFDTILKRRGNMSINEHEVEELRKNWITWANNEDVSNIDFEWWDEHEDNSKLWNIMNMDLSQLKDSETFKLLAQWTEDLANRMIDLDATLVDLYILPRILSKPQEYKQVVVVMGQAHIDALLYMLTSPELGYEVFESSRYSIEQGHDFQCLEIPDTLFHS